MDNKKVVSNGLIACSFLFTLIGLGLIISPFKDMLDKLVAHQLIEFSWYSLFWCGLGTYLMVCGVGLFNHKKWAWKHTVVYCFIISLSLTILITSTIVTDVAYDGGFLVLFLALFIYGVSLYFLSRPSVRRTFRLKL